MKFLIGVVIVFGCVVGGYLMHHGKLEVLWQPNEVIIIFGAACGAFVIGSPGKLIKDTLKSLKLLFKGSPYKSKDYVELLTMLYTVFKTIRMKGLLAMEAHVEKPEESTLFSQFPAFSHDHHAMHFFSDYLRIMTMGVEDYYQIEELMDRELNVHKKHGEHIAHTVALIADGMPALGIVAAVLGVITTMGSITEPPEVLGGLIGAALVGTFLGVLLSYGLIAPMGRHIGDYYADKLAYMICIKNALLSHLKGNAPAVSVEFARTSLPEHEKPSFSAVEEACNALPPIS